MRGVFAEAEQFTRQINGQSRQSSGAPVKIVRPRKFGAVAKVLWPFKTAAHVAAIAGRDERTAARWLSGEFEPPAIVIAHIILEMMKVE